MAGRLVELHDLSPHKVNVRILTLLQFLAYISCQLDNVFKTIFSLAFC
jgi:hypothetical protein